MDEPLIVPIVLNTNRRQDTLECLASLARQTYGRVRTIVLDNASTDGSVDAIRREFAAVEVLPLTDNRGYAGNNNVGLEAALKAGADWVFVLNEDTVLSPDCIEQLVVEGTRDSRVGIVGPLVYHHDEPTVIQSAGASLDRWWFGHHAGQNEDDDQQYAAPRDVDWISGCAILVRRGVVQQVGPLDERFFYYWEETEWCVRARRGGWRIRHVPAARVWHKGVQRVYSPPPSVTYYDTRNRLLLLSRHDAPLAVRMMAWWQIARTLASWSLNPRWQHKRLHRDAMWRGATDYIRGRWGRM